LHAPADPPLRTLQAMLQEAITAPEAEDALLRRRVEAAIRGPHDTRGAIALDIYRGLYRARLVHVLAEDHPLTRAVLGAGAFGRLARAFVDEHPSTSFTLDGYGDAFAGWIAGRGGEDAPLAADLARLDLASRQVASAPEGEWASGSIGAGAGLRIALHLRLLDTDHALFRLHEAWRHGSRLERPPRAQSHYAVHRRQGEVRLLVISRSARDLLAALQAGQPLEEALAEGPPASPRRLERWFRVLAAAGLVRPA
jgi:hypothetical protein